MMASHRTKWGTIVGNTHHNQSCFHRPSQFQHNWHGCDLNQPWLDHVKLVPQQLALLIVQVCFEDCLPWRLAPFDFRVGPGHPNKKIDAKDEGVDNSWKYMKIYVWKIWSLFASMINVYHISPRSIYVFHIDVYMFVNMLWCVHIMDFFIIHAKNINHQSQAQENKQKRNHLFYECDPLELRGFLWFHVSVHCHQAYSNIATHHLHPP